MSNEELHNWIETAAQNQRNTDFYRNIVVEIGEMFGIEAKTSDDESIQWDVLALRVPELVKRIIDDRDMTLKVLKRILEERGRIPAESILGMAIQLGEL